MSAAWLVYVTTNERAEAVEIGRALVEARLAACVNIIDPVTSIYWREGAVQEDSETVLVVKTRDELVVQLTDRVKTLHSSSCPCVVALPVEGENPDYLEWIARETAAASADQDG